MRKNVIACKYSLGTTPFRCVARRQVKGGGPQANTNNLIRVCTLENAIVILHI